MLKKRSNKKIMPFKAVFGKRKFIFPMEYATECDQATGKKGMLVSINRTNTFIPCGEPIDLTWEVWSLLKNIGRVARIVNVAIDEDDKKKV
jgi:hypothetical protein